MLIRIKDNVKPHEVRCGGFIRAIRPEMELEIDDKFWGVFKDIANKVKIKESEVKDGE